MTIPVRGSLSERPWEERHAAAEALHMDGWTYDAAMSHVEGACDRAICCGFDDPLNLDPRDALTQIVAGVRTAQAALDDEGEGDFRRAVYDIETLAVDLARLVRAW